MADIVGRKLVPYDRDGKLTNLLKRTYLRRWVGTLDGSGNEAEVYHNNEGKLFGRRSNSMDFARLVKIFLTLSLNCMMHDCIDVWFLCMQKFHMNLSTYLSEKNLIYKNVLFVPTFFINVIIVFDLFQNED